MKELYSINFIILGIILISKSFKSTIIKHLSTISFFYKEHAGYICFIAYSYSIINFLHYIKYFKILSKGISIVNTLSICTKPGLSM